MSDSRVEVPTGGARVLSRSNLNSLLETLAAAGYRVTGPTVRDGAVVLADIEKEADFPAGWTDQQEPGMYRVEQTESARIFGFAVGPHSLKHWLFAPRRQLLSADRGQNGDLSFDEIVSTPEKLAVVGARPCDLAGVLVQDRVFMGDMYPDGDYTRRRNNLFIAVVNCSHPASTCFCSSMGTGPSAGAGFDLALTELLDEGRHDFLIEAGSEKGANILDALGTRPAEQDDWDLAAKVAELAEAAMTRTLNTDGIHDLLLDNLNHPMWDDIAERCLACANCTMACPTCFCSTVEDVTDLSGDHAERWQAWDSCFTIDHAYIHGGSVRKSTKSRYRQWMTHKLASWIDQFGTSGCVGCGRCISWCPVGIDITEEAAKLRASTSIQRKNGTE